jgi:hypothetical protein
MTKKLAEFLKVDINVLFGKKSASKIIVKQNTDNKDTSVNGIVILLADKDAVSELIEVIKQRFGMID